MGCHHFFTLGLLQITRQWIILCHDTTNMIQIPIYIHIFIRTSALDRHCIYFDRSCTSCWCLAQIPLVNASSHGTFCDRRINDLDSLGHPSSFPARLISDELETQLPLHRLVFFAISSPPFQPDETLSLPKGMGLTALRHYLDFIKPQGTLLTYTLHGSQLDTAIGHHWP